MAIIFTKVEICMDSSNHFCRHECHSLYSHVIYF